MVNREHREPLSRVRWRLSRRCGGLGCGSPFVFPNRRGNPIGITAISNLLVALKSGAVPHGSRSNSWDWMAEDTDHPREVAEAALVHTACNSVEAAHRRTDLFERRRRLMDD